VLENELDAMTWAAELLDVKPAAKPKPKPPREAPQTTIDALMYCFRERGMGAFEERANRARLKELSDTQRAALRDWVKATKQVVPA
jgi:hypothetical protein